LIGCPWVSLLSSTARLSSNKLVEKSTVIRSSWRKTSLIWTRLLRISRKLQVSTWLDHFPFIHMIK
jgi:hypothetical protein